jgi:hypothetical protein
MLQIANLSKNMRWRKSKKPLHNAKFSARGSVTTGAVVTETAERMPWVVAEVLGMSLENADTSRVRLVSDASDRRDAPGALQIQRGSTNDTVLIKCPRPCS